MRHKGGSISTKGIFAISFAIAVWRCWLGCSWFTAESLGSVIISCNFLVYCCAGDTKLHFSSPSSITFLAWLTFPAGFLPTTLSSTSAKVRYSSSLTNLALKRPLDQHWWHHRDSCSDCQKSRRDSVQPIAMQGSHQQPILQVYTRLAFLARDYVNSFLAGFFSYLLQSCSLPCLKLL